MVLNPQGYEEVYASVPKSDIGLMLDKATTKKVGFDSPLYMIDGYMSLSEIEETIIPQCNTKEKKIFFDHICHQAHVRDYILFS
jgi:hypothetical protein